MIRKHILALSIAASLALMCGCEKEPAVNDTSISDSTVSEETITFDETSTDDSDTENVQKDLQSDDSESTSDTSSENSDTNASDSDTASDDEASKNSDIASDDEAVASDFSEGAKDMKLALDGTHIVDSNNNPVQLKGVSTHGIGWFPQYVNYDAFKCMRDVWGINCVRLAMYSDEGAGYCTGGDKNELKTLVNKGVGYATDLGMYVIIDWHVLGEGDPNVHKDDAIEFFKEMSSNYASNDNVIYEICNEPNGNVKWADVKSYAEEVIPVIRERDNDALIIVGTPTWSQDVDIAAADPIKDYDNILYAIHFYADTHKDDLRAKMAKALDAGLPLFCSEFGICDASGNGSVNIEEADKWIAAMNEAKMSYCIWNLSNKNESSSLISAGCIKTADWTYEDLSDEGKWYLGVLGAKVADAKNSEADKEEVDAKNSETAKENADAEASEGLCAKASDVNRWNDGKNNFCQIDVNISNKGKTKNTWKVTIELENDFEIDQEWNGVYKQEGKKVIITPVDYNKTLKDGDSYDIGFIVKSAKDIKIKNVSY